MQMKMIVLLALFTSASFILAEDIPVENLKDVVMKELHNVKVQVAMECAAVYPVENSTIRQIMTHDGIPDNQEVKCWLSCVLRNMGIINNGKVDWKKAIELNKMVLKSDEDKVKIDQIFEICKKEVEQDEDECQLAYNIAICKFKYGKELELPNGTWEE
uniref:Odorant binding protein 43 n=1 Tax=Nezara viridula TaxID=85310 RepID=A0A4Y5RDI2_NEZVI|nr:odorant binding protein 43 [Nezara viridula]